MYAPFDQLTSVFREGGGVDQGEYSADFWDGMQRELATRPGSRPSPPGMENPFNFLYELRP